MLDKLQVKGKEYVFEIKPGVFAQYGIDFGSKLLLETVKFPEYGNVLDIGSGCGVLGIVLAGMSPQSKVYLVDSDIRAVRLSKKNARRNNINNVKVILSDVIADLPKNLKFDLVVSNPPTHQGREVLEQFIKGARSVLIKKGTVYFVVNRMTSVMKIMAKVFNNCEKVKRKKGYIVYKSIKQISLQLFCLSFYWF